MTSVKTPPKAVVFDWDNTLVDSWLCIQAAMNATLRRMEHPEWDMEETKARVALSLRDSFPTMFGDRWEEAREIFYQSFEAIHIDHLRPLPGAAAMLEALAKLGVHLSVVSNKNGRYLRQEAKHLGWDGLFARLVGATDAAEDKPSPAPVHLALAESGIAAGAEVWFVGDGEVDMRCAVNAGCLPVLMREEAERDGEFARFPPSLRLFSCSELAQLVHELLVPISPI